MLFSGPSLVPFGCVALMWHATLPKLVRRCQENFVLRQMGIRKREGGRFQSIFYLSSCCQFEIFFFQSYPFQRPKIKPVSKNSCCLNEYFCQQLFALPRFFFGFLNINLSSRRFHEGFFHVNDPTTSDCIRSILCTEGQVRHNIPVPNARPTASVGRFATHPHTRESRCVCAGAHPTCP